ncbi:uncharacterized protein LOC125761811 [Anopheles funestus]|uniref:uncharacterized protein LOC125761811 n=1 Tax=Anopheles funestus TaxID=62324 RepID=UPI0007D4FA54|nr:uncharacterized protein LOC125761811 [Anopheles funestus]XP_049279279.1 uncharacterized protein LOC125761811 [Anopheles funestus]
MTDFDAASALLMLSSGFQQYKNENNNIHTLLKTTASSTPSSTCSSPPKKRERKNESPKQRILQPTLRIASVHANYKQQELLDRLSEPMRLSVSPPSILEPLPKKRNSRMMQMRMDSSSPEMENWDNRSILSPTLELHQEITAKGNGSMLYTSPGMNGFAMLLKSQNNQYTSSPKPPSVVTTFMEDNRKKRFLDNPIAEEGASAIVVAADKPARSPSDSGVSSILDEIQQPNLVLQRWNKEMEALDSSIPASVQMELEKINEISAYNKEIFTKAKMTNFSLEMTFHPAKSRMRKKCTNEVDNQDRIRNNEASRRSRHKKKLITHLMNISLEFDRMENRHLYMEERRLEDFILELEEKALSCGIDAQIVKNLRSSCGFQ